MYQCGSCGYESAKWMGFCPRCQTGEGLEEVATTSVREGFQGSGAFADLAVEGWRNRGGPTFRWHRRGRPRARGRARPGRGDPRRWRTRRRKVDAATSDGRGDAGRSGGHGGRQGARWRPQKSPPNKLASGLAGSGSRATTCSCWLRTTSTPSFGRPNRFVPSLLVVDSVQTVGVSEVSSSPGAVAQVRECSARLIRFAKESGIATVLVGHVTKDGGIAGPKLLEHMVDVVLYLEGETDRGFRTLHSLKNRFGATHLVGLVRDGHRRDDRGGRSVGRVRGRIGREPFRAPLCSRPFKAVGRCS